jgi:hypothetical protein
VFKNFSFLSLVTLTLLAVVALCIIHPGDWSIIISVLFIPFVSVLMLFYLFLAWRRLTVKNRLNILLSIAAWSGLFYGLASHIRY